MRKSLVALCVTLAACVSGQTAGAQVPAAVTPADYVKALRVAFELDEIHVVVRGRTINADTLISETCAQMRTLAQECESRGRRFRDKRNLANDSLAAVEDTVSAEPALHAKFFARFMARAREYKQEADGFYRWLYERAVMN